MTVMFVYLFLLMILFNFPSCHLSIFHYNCINDRGCFLLYSANLVQDF